MNRRDLFTRTPPLVLSPGLFVLALVVSVLSCTSSVFAQETRRDDIGSDKSIGVISWVIHEGGTDKVVKEGTSTIRLSDFVYASNHKYPSVIQKQIQVGNQFVLRTTAQDDENIDIVGLLFFYPFFQADKNNINPPNKTFSLNFHVLIVSKDSSRARRMRHGEYTGEELEIAVKQYKSGQELTRMEFLTDFSFGLVRSSDDILPERWSWRIVIKKGSVITWPSVVDGKVIPN